MSTVITIPGEFRPRTSGRPGPWRQPSDLRERHRSLVCFTATRHTGKFDDASASRGMQLSKHRIFTIKFSSVYPLYVQKAERKDRTKAEVDRIICWLTGYSQAELRKQIKQENDFETFFAQAPAIHPDSSLIRGVVCGVRVEDIEDPLMKKIRYLDKLIDELAKGKDMENLLRKSS